jgi:hypothetical protein
MLSASVAVIVPWRHDGPTYILDPLVHLDVPTALASLPTNRKARRVVPYWRGQGYPASFGHGERARTGLPEICHSVIGMASAAASLNAPCKTGTPLYDAKERDERQHQRKRGYTRRVEVVLNNQGAFLPLLFSLAYLSVLVLDYLARLVAFEAPLYRASSSVHSKKTWKSPVAHCPSACQAEQQLSPLRWLHHSQMLMGRFQVCVSARTIPMAPRACN